MPKRRETKGKYPRQCAYCGTAYMAKTPSGKFCSTLHRKAYHRLGEKLDDELIQVARMVGRWQKTTGKYPGYQSKFHENLERLAKLIDAARLGVPITNGG